MARTYKVSMSGGQLWAVVIEYRGVSDYQARVVRLTEASFPDLSVIPQDRWTYFHSAGTNDGALGQTLIWLTPNNEYVREVLLETEQPRDRLLSALNNALAQVEKQDARIHDLEQYLIGESLRGVELARDVARLKEELRISSRLCVDLANHCESADQYVAQCSKGEA